MTTLDLTFQQAVDLQFLLDADSSIYRKAADMMNLKERAVGNAVKNFKKIILSSNLPYAQSHLLQKKSWERLPRSSMLKDSSHLNDSSRRLAKCILKSVSIWVALERPSTQATQELI
jgi:hypothetical protein